MKQNRWKWHHNGEMAKRQRGVAARMAAAIAYARRWRAARQIGGISYRGGSIARRRRLGGNISGGVA